MGSIPAGGHLEAEILLTMAAERKREGIARVRALPQSRQQMGNALKLFCTATLSLPI